MIRQQYWISPPVGLGPLFSATQRAARNLAGHGRRLPADLALPRLRAPGHRPRPRRTAGPRRARATRRAAPGWPADQGADDALRREWLLRLILFFDEQIGSLQRHWLTRPYTDDCPALRLARLLPPPPGHHRRRLGSHGLR